MTDMTEKDIVKNLKGLKTDIHPDKNWVLLTRQRLLGEEKINRSLSFSGISKAFFTTYAPKPAMVYAAGVFIVVFVAVLAGGYNRTLDEIANNGFGGVHRYGNISGEAIAELNKIAKSANLTAALGDKEAITKPNTSNTVVFREGIDKQELFKKALKENIETKINKLRDSLAQLEDGALAREISLNSRKFEENFEKLANKEIASQVGDLLDGAEGALEDGNLIDALDLVIAAEKLAK